MADWLLILLLVLATYRVTRLIIEDSFPPIAVPRDHLINWWAPDEEWILAKDRHGAYKHPKANPHWGALGRSLRYLFTCPWCMSVWVGTAIVWGTDVWFAHVPLPVFVVAAASGLTGLMSALEEKLSAK